MSGSEQAATAVISAAVAERLKELGEAAGTAVEELRRELERTPRIGLRREGLRPDMAVSCTRRGWSREPECRV